MPSKRELNEHAKDYLCRLEEADRASWRTTDLIIDTNVMAEILSFKDLIVLFQEHSLEEVLRQPSLKYRQFRVKHSILLGWWLSQTNFYCGTLGVEVVDILTGKLSPKEDGLSFSLTRAIVHIVHSLAMSEWRRGALVEVDHKKTGSDADREILKAAQDGPIPVITWEGFQRDGTYSSDPSKLRNLCISANVPVFSPEEYLSSNRVDISAEALRFLAACDHASWRAHWDRLPGWRIIGNLIGLYRFILLDEVSEEYAPLIERYRALDFRAQK